MTLEQLSKISMKFTTATQMLYEVMESLDCNDTQKRVMASYFDDIKEVLLKRIGKAYIERKQDV